MSNLIDKFLVFLMIIILPVGIFISSKVSNVSEEEQLALVEEAKLKKIDTALAEIKTAATPKKGEPKIPPIEITKVTYATESGKLKIEGKAPTANLNVMVQAVVTPKATPKPKPKKITKVENAGSSSAQPKEEDVEVDVLGVNVDVVAVKTKEDGSFLISKDIDEDVALMEIRFDQGESTATIQYDFIAKKKIL